MNDTQHAYTRMICKEAGCFECKHQIIKPGRGRPSYGCRLGGQGCDKLRKMVTLANAVLKELCDEAKAKEPKP